MAPGNIQSRRIDRDHHWQADFQQTAASWDDRNCSDRLLNQNDSRRGALSADLFSRHVVGDPVRVQPAGGVAL